VLIDAAAVVNGTWNQQGIIIFPLVTQPIAGIVNWRLEHGEFYENGNKYQNCQVAGNVIQAETTLPTGARMVLSIQFLNTNEAIVKSFVFQSPDGRHSAGQGETRALRVQ